MPGEDRRSAPVRPPALGVGAHRFFVRAGLMPRQPPSRAKAAGGMDMARRNIEANRALDLLEAAAITADRGN